MIIMKILVINAGSSSIKYQLIDMETENALATGLCDRIGIDGHIKHKALSKGLVFETDMAFPSHSEAITAVLAALTDAEHGVVASMSEISAVGHRVAHGGPNFSQSCIIDDKCISEIERCIPLGPLHNPANLLGIRACQEAMPGISQIAVFDTAFHQTMPEKAYIYPIPYEYYERDMIRRYGFHGTSHRYITSVAEQLMGKPASEFKLISCHLGNGSSIAAVNGGKSVDTSMGFTPIAGLPMGTRCGDIDSSIIKYLMQHEDLTIDEVDGVLNKKSGITGISGISSDMRDIESAMKEGNERAKLAFDILNYDIAKYVGAYAAAMNGVDIITFTGGIGENGALTRAEVCKYLGFLGVEIDEAANSVRRPDDDYFISTPDSKVKVAVIHTNEELVIARDALALVTAK